MGVDCHGDLHIPHWLTTEMEMGWGGQEVPRQNEAGGAQSTELRQFGFDLELSHVVLRGTAWGPAVGRWHPALWVSGMEVELAGLIRAECSL
jgi:hypothetical protein